MCAAGFVPDHHSAGTRFKASSDALGHSRMPRRSASIPALRFPLEFEADTGGLRQDAVSRHPAGIPPRGRHTELPKYSRVRISRASRPDRPTSARARLHSRSFERGELREFGVSRSRRRRALRPASAPAAARRRRGVRSSARRRPSGRPESRSRRARRSGTSPRGLRSRSGGRRRSG